MLVLLLPALLLVPVVWLTSILTIGGQLNKLTAPEDTPRRIKLCRRLLVMLPRWLMGGLWGRVQLTLGNSLTQNPDGDEAEDMERALFHLQQAARVISREKHPEPWAVLHTGFGYVYHARKRGDRAENLEHAINHATHAFEVTEREESPANWALMQNNLGAFHMLRVYGDRAENLERAAHHCEQSAQVFTVEAYRKATALEPLEPGKKVHPLQRAAEDDGLGQVDLTYWGMPYVNLAQIYRELAGDDGAEENLARAIEYGEQALELSGPTPSVDRWITVHVALANAYLDRMALGNRATNLMKAQQYCKAAANADASEAKPGARAELEQCLGRVVMASPSSDRAASLRRAIEHFNRALQFNPWPGGRDHAKIQARLQAAEDALAVLD